ncbi:hypothetical protein [Rhodococcus qingshengii]
MTVSGSRRRPLVLRLSLTAAIAVAVAGSSVAFASPAVSAPMPVRTAAAPAFTAGLCEGTEYTPSEQMLDISGIRLDHYNDGNIVPMYGTTDRGTSAAVDAPVCGVRDVDGIAKSEWMYCTDFDLDPCAGVDENGLPVDKHNDEMGATVPSSGNPDLSADDLAVISWLLQNPAKLDGVVSGNSSEDARSARQTLVWCVSDYDNPLMADFKSLCDRNIGDDERARIVEIMNVTQTLDLVRKTPATGTLKAGETAVFTLNTNMYRKPITVQSSAGTELTVCGDNAKATLTANQLTVDGRGDAQTAVDLCLTAAAGGDYSVTASVIPDSVENLHWNTAGAQCQIFASFDTVRPASMNASASVGYAAAPTTTPATSTPATTTPATTTPATTTPATPVVPIVPIVPIVPVVPGAPVPSQPVATPATPAPSAPKPATGPRPVAIDGGAAEQNSGRNVAVVVTGLGLVGMAAAGAVALRRKRS